MKKKTIQLLLLLFVAIGMQAQIPNGGFENWTTISNDWHLTYFHQNGADNNDGLHNDGVKYQPAQNGSYAIKLLTQSSEDVSSISSGITANLLKSGFPYTQQPTKLRFYAKYNIKQGDTASVLIAFKKNGDIISGSLSNNLFTITGSHENDYQLLEFAITGLTSTPDSVIIAISSANFKKDLGIGGSTPQAGTYLIVDNLSFDTSEPIPYGDFEEWGRPALQPDNYIMQEANDAVVDYNTINPLQKTTDAHSGSFALKASTWLDPDSGDKRLLRFNGYNGNAPVDKETKFPCTQKTGTFRAWYKYIPASSDTANIAITFFKNGTPVGGISKDLYAKSSYSGISIPFNCSVNPDSAIIHFFSSKNNLIKNIGSTLYLDDLSLEPDVEWHNYEANLTPDNDGWSATSTMNGTIPVANPSSSSILAVNSSNNYLSCVSDSTHTNGYEYGSELMSNTPLTVMLRAKSSVQSGAILGGYFEIDYGPSYRNTVLKFKWRTTEAIPYRYVSISNAAATGTAKVDFDSWHTYRITFNGDSLRLYIDEGTTPVIAAKPYLASPAKTSTYALKIVGSDISNFASSDIDWISWNYKGAYAPGQGTLPSCYVNPNGTGVNDAISTKGIYSIQPNPVADAFQIKGLDSEAKLIISDLAGKTILCKTIYNNENISASELTPGVYIVRIQTAKGSEDKRLIKK